LPTDPQGELSTLTATLEPNVQQIVFTRVAEQQMFQTSFLRKFTGDYDAPGLPWTVALVGDSLQLQFPGAPPRKLIPRHGTRFDVGDMTGVSLEFKQDTTGTTQEIVLYTPDTVSAIPKKK